MKNTDDIFSVFFSLRLLTILFRVEVLKINVDIFSNDDHCEKEILYLGFSFIGAECESMV